MIKDNIKDFLQLWAQFSMDKLTDSTYWLGWITAWTALLGFLLVWLFPAMMRGGFTPVISFYAQIFKGWFWSKLRAYPDLIGAAMHIMRRTPEGKLEFALDYTYGEKLVVELSRNPFKAFTLRQTWVFAHAADCFLPRLNHYGPKNIPRLVRFMRWWRGSRLSHPLRWVYRQVMHRAYPWAKYYGLTSSRQRRRIRAFWKRRLTQPKRRRTSLRRKLLRKLGRNPNPLKHFSKKKARIWKRYQGMYKSVLASLGELTNENAMLAMLGVPMATRQMLVCKTFARWPDQDAYHRIHVFDAEVLANWQDDPGEDVLMLKPEYPERYLLTGDLARMYRRYPWKFGVFTVYIKPEDDAKRIPVLPPGYAVSNNVISLYKRRPPQRRRLDGKPWLPHHEWLARKGVLNPTVLLRNRRRKAA
ncbi:MAG: hypothetical protein GC129_05320 [Proteobacteria bacterium]|nr:hypothetical protein [Pseudomonadota bacterium]